MNKQDPKNTGGSLHTVDAKLDELSNKIRLMSIGIVACIVVAIVSFLLSLPLLAFASILGVCGLSYFINKKKAEKKRAAADVIRETIGESIDIIEYNAFGSIPESAIESVELMPHWDEFSGSDLVQGIYRGVNMSFSDIHLVDIEVYRDSDGKRQTRRNTVFKGQWIVCELPKTIAHTVRIKERPAVRILPYKSDVETEYTAFNKKYQILADDSHTVFYILTPHFIEYIMSADLLAEGQTFFCFSGNRVYIAIDNRRDMFEVSGKNEKVKDIKERVEKEMKYLTDIVDELLQNKYLFGGED